MARPREFDTEDALARALDVYWERGYSDATMPELLDGMGLSRGSLYKAFKDKKSLYLLVLTIYDEQTVSDAIVLLTEPQLDGRDRILALFDSIASTVEAGDRRGCLLCSAVAGPASYDADIATLAARSLARLRRAFQAALEASEIDSDAEPLAQFLVTQYIGLRILSRTNISASSIRQNVQALRNILIGN